MKNAPLKSAQRRGLWKCGQGPALPHSSTAQQNQKKRTPEALPKPALIDGLKSGKAVLIVDRGRPVARLEPIEGGEKGGQDGRLARLIREGVLRPRRSVAPAAVFTSPPPASAASAVAALIDERRGGR